MRAFRYSFELFLIVRASDIPRPPTPTKFGPNLPRDEASLSQIRPQRALQRRGKSKDDRLLRRTQTTLFQRGAWPSRRSQSGGGRPSKDEPLDLRKISQLEETRLRLSDVMQPQIPTPAKFLFIILTHPHLGGVISPSRALRAPTTAPKQPDIPPKITHFPYHVFKRSNG